MNKQIDISPCSSIILSIPDNDTLYITSLNDNMRYVYNFAFKINSSFNYIKYFYQNQTEQQSIFDFPQLNPDITMKDMRLQQLFVEIRDIGFQQLLTSQKQLLDQKKINFKSFLTTLLSSIYSIKTPQQFTFGRPNSKSIIQGLFAIVGRRIPEVKNIHYYPPLQGPEILSFINLKLLQSYMSQTVNLVMKNCKKSAGKMLAENYFIQNQKQYLYNQFFTVHKNLKNLTPLHQTPFFIEEEIEFRVFKFFVSKNVLPTIENMHIYLPDNTKIDDLDTAIALNAIYSQNFAIDLQINAQLQNQIDRVVIWQIIQLQRQLKYLMGFKLNQENIHKFDLTPDETDQQQNFDEISTTIEENDELSGIRNHVEEDFGSQLGYQNNIIQSQNDQIGDILNKQDESDLSDDKTDKTDELSEIRNQTTELSEENTEQNNQINNIRNQTEIDDILLNKSQYSVDDASTVRSPINEEISQIMNQQNSSDDNYNNYYNDVNSTNQTSQSNIYSSYQESYFYDNLSSKPLSMSHNTDLAASALTVTKRAKSVTFADDKDDIPLKNDNKLDLSELTNDNQLNLSHMNLHELSDEISQMMNKANSSEELTDYPSNLVSQISGANSDNKQQVTANSEQADREVNFNGAIDEIQQQIKKISLKYNDEEDEISQILNSQEESAGADEQNELSQLANQLEKSSSSDKTDEISQLLNVNNESEETNFRQPIITQTIITEIPEIIQISTILNTLPHTSIFIDCDAPEVNIDVSPENSVVHMENPSFIQTFYRNKKQLKQIKKDTQKLIKLAQIASFEYLPSYLSTNYKSPENQILKIAFSVVTIQVKARKFIKNNQLINIDHDQQLNTIASIKIQSAFRSFTTRNCFNYAKLNNLIPVTYPSDYNSLTKITQKLQNLLFLKAKLSKFILKNTTQQIEIYLSYLQKTSPIYDLVLQFLAQFLPQTPREAIQLAETYTEAAELIAFQVGVFLSRKSRKTLIQAELQPSIFTQFLQPKKVVFQTRFILKRTIFIQSVARFFLQKTAILIDQNLSYLNLTPSNLIQAKFYLQNASLTIQKFIRANYQFCEVVQKYLSPSQHIHVNNALSTIQRAFKTFKHDKIIIKNSIKPLLSTSIKSLQPALLEVEDAISTLQTRLHSIYITNPILLYTFKLHTNSISFPLSTSFHYIHSICKIQSFYKTMLWTQQNQKLCKLASQAFARIVFARNHPDVSLQLHAELLTLTEQPEKHIRSLQKLSHFSVPYHVNLIRSLIRCLKFEISADISFKILAEILPQNFVQYVGVDGKAFEVVGLAVQVKGVNAARFLKNLAKFVPEVAVLGVSEVLKWRKMEINEEVRRLLKGYLFWVKKE